MALRAVGTECRPYQSFGPMAGIDTSQPMSKITLRRMLPLEHRYYIKNPLSVMRWNFGKLRGSGGVFRRHAACSRLHCYRRDEPMVAGEVGERPQAYE